MKYLFLSMMLFCGNSWASSYNDLPRGTTAEIVCVGDSIVWGGGSGFPLELSRLTKKAVINAGLPSDTSYGVFLRAREWIKTKPKYLIVQAGYNDNKYAIMRTNQQHLFRDENDAYLSYQFHPITIADFQDFIDSIYNLCQNYGVKVFFTTISINPSSPPEPRLKFLNEILKVYPDTIEIKLNSSHFVDMIHLNQEGYKEFAKQVYEAIIRYAR